MATHHTPDGLLLKLRLPAGRCEIETADTTETVVEAEPMNGSAASREAAEALVETLSRALEGGHELRRRGAEAQAARARLNNAQVLVRIRGPHGLELDAATASADVVARGRLGAADVRTASGDVTIETPSGDRGEDGERRRRARPSMRGAGDVNTMSGDVTVRRDRRAALTVNTMSGDVRIERPASGAIQLRSMSGDLEAAIAPRRHPLVDANSASGDVRSELPVTGSAPAGGHADVELRATSMSGDIVVDRRRPRAVAGAARSRSARLSRRGRAAG